MKLLLVLVVGLALGWLLTDLDGALSRAGEWVDQARAGTSRSQAPAASIPAGRSLTVRVVDVLDGDSLRVTDGRRELEVRLYGIDAPEHRQPGSDAARTALRRLTQGARLQLRVRDTDRFGRAVGDLYRDDDHLNEALVAAGHAWVFRRYSQDPALLRAEARARAAGLGLWGGDAPVAPWAWRDRKVARRNGAAEALTPTVPAAAAAPNSSGSPCRIKGNLSSRGERIYHLPGQKYYEDTRISPGRGERWFCSEQEARAAGWRRARN